jgi:hypothetical protein
MRVGKIDSFGKLITYRVLTVQHSTRALSPGWYAAYLINEAEIDTITGAPFQISPHGWTQNFMVRDWRVLDTPAPKKVFRAALEEIRAGVAPYLRASTHQCLRPEQVHASCDRALEEGR